MNSKRTTCYQGLGYKALQKDNCTKRGQLPKIDYDFLKVNGYRNVGWNNVISLFDKIKTLTEFAEWSLEDLFLEADRIGEKYQEPGEIQAFQAEMAAEAEQISEIIDQILPDNEPEIINFSRNYSPKKWHKSKQQKTYYIN